MKNIFTILALIASLTVACAKADISTDDATKLIELNQKETEAFKALQNAEQAALNGEISEDELYKVRNRYDQRKSLLDQALSKLPNKTEIEQWLIDQNSTNCH